MIVRFLVLIGLPLVAARILSVLIMEGRPLSLDELSRKTGYVKSHISTTLKYLEEKLVIEKIYGKRKKLMVKLKEGALKNLLMDHIEKLKNHINEIIEYMSYSEKRIDAIIRDLSDVLEKLEVDKD